MSACLLRLRNSVLFHLIKLFFLSILFQISTKVSFFLDYAEGKRKNMFVLKLIIQLIYKAQGLCFKLLWVLLYCKIGLSKMTKSLSTISV